MEIISKVGFIKPNGTSVYMEYYEVENFCIEEIKKIISVNVKLMEKFQNFQKKYSYFKPYFDFIVFEMGYIFLNPLLKESKFGIIENIDLSKKTSSPMLQSTPMNDENLHIKELSFGFYPSSIITVDDFVLDKENYISHKNLLDHILNQILISSKEIYYDYLKYKNEGNYLVNRLGFMWFANYEVYEEGVLLIYTPNLFTEKQRRFYLGLKDYYINDSNYVKNELDVNQIKESERFIKEYKKARK